MASRRSGKHRISRFDSREVAEVAAKQTGTGRINVLVMDVDRAVRRVMVNLDSAGRAMEGTVPGRDGRAATVAVIRVALVTNETAAVANAVDR